MLHNFEHEAQAHVIFGRKTSKQAPNRGNEEKNRLQIKYAFWLIAFPTLIIKTITMTPKYFSLKTTIFSFS